MPFQNLEIYPNPFSSESKIKSSLPMKDVFINVYNMLGKIVFSCKQKTTELIDLSSLTSGIYFIDFESGPLKIRRKVIKDN